MTEEELAKYHKPAPLLHATFRCPQTGRLLVKLAGQIYFWAAQDIAVTASFECPYCKREHRSQPLEDPDEV